MPRLFLISICIFMLSLSLPLHAGYESRDDVKQFINMMHSKHQFDKAQLTQWFAKATKQTKTLQAIAKPAEGLPWHKYRKIFLTEKRTKKGVEFWKENRAALERAEKEYGVPPEIITAIIGVETFYGVYKGKYPAFDTLVTLGFDYPKRGKFFRSELENYLLLVREEELDAFDLKGSYAAAMGKPQFISSSYRHYAVDFDGDGKRDLLNNTTDAIGSVANYFKRHGWRAGETATITANYKGSAFPEFKMKPTKSIASLSSSQVFPTQPVKTSALATPIQLELESGYEYWLGLHNFYVITRYNHSNLYAMAVYQLSQAIKQGMNP